MWNWWSDGDLIARPYHFSDYALRNARPILKFISRRRYREHELMFPFDNLLRGEKNTHTHQILNMFIPFLIYINKTNDRKHALVSDSRSGARAFGTHPSGWRSKCFKMSRKSCAGRRLKNGKISPRRRLCLRDSETQILRFFRRDDGAAPHEFAHSTDASSSTKTQKSYLVDNKSGDGSVNKQVYAAREHLI